MPHPRTRKEFLIADIAPDIVLPAGLEDVIAHGLGKLSSERIATTADYAARLDAIMPSGFVMRRGAG